MRRFRAFFCLKCWIWTALLVGCGLPVRTATPTATPEDLRYISYAAAFTVIYPAGWTIVGEGEQSVVLAPIAERNWQPATPEQIGANPQVRFEWGAGVGENLRYAGFPASVSSASVRAWLEQRVQTGAARDLVVTSIDGATAFVVVEPADPGCTRAVYWRPEAEARLVRITTGCTSAYLADFERIIGALATDA